jgi:hypothetical protein
LIDFGLLVLEKKIFKIFQCIFTLSVLSALGEGYPLLLKSLKSSPSKDDLCQVWLKLAQLCWRRFLNGPIPFSYFLIISPLKKTWPFI